MKMMIPFVVVFGALWLGDAALAGAGTDAPEWRPTYDHVMLWFNFGILVFILYKVLKKPLKGFLEDRKGEVSGEIEKVEAQKRAITEEIEAATRLVKESAARLEGIKERIVARGENEKTRLIEDARQQSRILIENSRRKAESQYRQAHAKLREELLDAAFTMALERLPREIGDTDRQGFIDRFLSGALN
jgi:F-type H+-transporting ATPase subunit b